MTLFVDVGNVTDIVFSDAGALDVPITTESGEYAVASRVGDAIRITGDSKVV